VWAEENTRASIFAAFKRKETFGTSGVRIQIRMFAGWKYPKDLVKSANYFPVQNWVPRRFQPLQFTTAY